MSNHWYATHCLICDEYIELTDREMCMLNYGHGRDIIRVCDKCKDAVKRMRNEETLKIPRDPDYGTVKINSNKDIL